MRLPLLSLPLVLLLGPLLACAGPVTPNTSHTGGACTVDPDCDPGDVCVSHECVGESGGPADGGGDAGTPADGGSTLGHLTLFPASTNVQVQVSVQASPVVLTLGNSGAALLHFSLACTGGATPSPAGGAVDAGGTTSAQIALPFWTATGQKSLACTATTSDGTGGPVVWTLTATVVTTPPSNPIGPSGGTVDLLDFVFTGDTRPGACDQTSSYPGAAFAGIAKAMAGAGAQFALDLGDHMYVCNGSHAEAVAQMKLYTDAIAAQWPSGKLWLMTMGNHECGVSSGSGNCLPATGDANFDAFLPAVQGVSQQAAVNYKLDFTTRHGLVRLVVAADNSYTTAAQTQLAGWLTEADTQAFATLVARHHTTDGTRDGPTWALNLFKAHKATLGLVAHAHSYARTAIARTSGGTIPTVVCGLGAANTSQRGFCRLQEQADGSFKLTHYDDTGAPQDTWSVKGQQ